MAAAWARFGLVFARLVFAYRLVQLRAIVQRLHAIVVNALKVVSKAHDVAAVIEKNAVGFASAGTAPKPSANHLNEGR